MRPAHAPLHFSPAIPLAALRPVASAAFEPRGSGYDARVRLRRRLVALRGGDDAVVVAMSWVGAKVHVDVRARGGWSSDDVESAIDAARRLAAVDDDPTEFLRMVRGHRVLGPLARRADPRLSATPTIFESLAVAIIEQLVTGFEARASVRRLWRLTGAHVPGTKLVAAPLPAAVRRLPMWKMHAIGIGSRRAVTLHDVSGRGPAIEHLRVHPPEVVVEKLQTLRGIGPWTANAVARSALAWSDAVPIGDFHAPFTIASALGDPRAPELSDVQAANEAMLDVLEPFRPHRARVALLLEARQGRWRPPRVDPHRREPWKY